MSSDTTPIAASKAIQRRTGRTFHLATRLFPERIRAATYVLYAFFRLADDVVDTADDRSSTRKRRRLERFRTAVLGGGSDVDALFEDDTDAEVLRAFRTVAERTAIPDREIEEFLAAMERDVDTDRYATFADLEAYLRGSSVAVAYMMLAVMDADTAEARPHARALGEAFQLTNFLRDVREDVRDFGRIYLPQETLARYEVGEREIREGTFSPRFAAALRHELRRAEARYREGIVGIEHLPKDCQFPVLVSAVLYAEHHRLIRRRDYDVLSKPPSLGIPRQLGLVARTWIRWKRDPDPVAVFDAVAAIDMASRSDAPDPDIDASTGSDSVSLDDGETRSWLSLNFLP